MRSLRTFVAVLLSPELKSRINVVQQDLRQIHCDVKWTAEENLHITLKFLGEVKENRMGEVCSAVENAAVGKFDPFDLCIGGVGAFPNTKKPQIIWIGAKSGSETLAKLAASIEDELCRLGFERERKRFSAHITIGRARSSKGFEDLSRAIQKAGELDFGIQRVESAAIMTSDLRPTGPIYTAVKEIKLC